MLATASEHCFFVYVDLKTGSDVSQQYLSILKAAKCDKNQEQPLVDAKNHGGLWKVKSKAVNIFKICEMEFLKYVRMFSYKINSHELLLKLLKIVVSSPIFWMCVMQLIKKLIMTSQKIY